MPKQISFGDFIERYSDNSACLQEIAQRRYPKGITCRKCKVITKHYRIKSRPVYCCKFCRAQTSPLANTIFHRTRISLADWFLAIYFITNTRSGFAALELQRYIGVNYHTAWRMLHKIREAMATEDLDLLKGIVEIDETYIGWRRNLWYGDNTPDAAVVMGFVERGGRARYRHIPNNGKITLLNQIFKNIDKKAHVMSDQLSSYKNLDKYGYKHDSVMHRKECVRGNVYTQTIEAGWGMLKRSLSGTYHRYSKKHLQKYLNEFEWRYTHRKEPERMFVILMKQAIYGLRG